MDLTLCLTQNLIDEFSLIKIRAVSDNALMYVINLFLFYLLFLKRRRADDLQLNNLMEQQTHERGADCSD